MKEARLTREAEAERKKFEDAGKRVPLAIEAPPDDDVNNNNNNNNNTTDSATATEQNSEHDDSEVAESDGDHAKDVEDEDEDTVDEEEDEKIDKHALAAARAAATRLMPVDSPYSLRLKADLDKWRVKFLSAYHRSKSYLYRRDRERLRRRLYLQVHHEIPILKHLLVRDSGCSSSGCCCWW